MNTKTNTFALTALMSVAFLVGNSAAQNSTNDTIVQNQRTIVKKVGYRLPNWKTIHGGNTKATHDTVATLKKIGCEIRESDHGGHVDVSFRCANWKTISVKNDEQSAQWHQWLVNNKFETVVVNPPATTQLPTVKIRLADWKTIHADSQVQAASIKETYQMIGCEVKIDNHGNHVDARIRCPNWTTVGLPNPKTAHVWQDWLMKSGFETQHDHSTDGHNAHAGHDHAKTDSHDGHDHK